MDKEERQTVRVQSRASWRPVPYKWVMGIVTRSEWSCMSGLRNEERPFFAPVAAAFVDAYLYAYLYIPTAGLVTVEYQRRSEKD
jgi:hypothetical protein